jgi:hypothetical protein
MNNDPEDTTNNPSLNPAAERSTADCGSAAAVAFRLGGNAVAGAPLVTQHLLIARTPMAVPVYCGMVSTASICRIPGC